ncbi:MAG: DNA-binding protein [Pseudonocardiales bacterium]|nr:MAG: DNA-binding protein [Pseudonocardiales bacterium]
MTTRPVRIQICGRLAIEIDGVRRDSLLPGRQGRLLLTYLVVHRHDDVPRAQLAAALWPSDPPDAADTAIYALLSKCRTALGPDLLSPRGAVRLELPPSGWVDLETARDAAHRAESALAQREWSRAWGAAQTSLFIARRGLLPEEDLHWIVAIRRELQSLYLRSLETYTAAALHLGDTELATAERAGRELITAAPFRESGYRLLMRALTARGNPAEALLVYDHLCRHLRDELGIAPSLESRDLHAAMLKTSP